MNNEMKMKIVGRDAVAYPKPNNILQVVLYQHEGDCPKGKSASERRFLCSGKCQNELVSVVFKKDELYVVAGILPKQNPIITWPDDDVCGERGYAKTREEKAALCRDVYHHKRTEIERLLPDDAQKNYETFLEKLNAGPALTCNIDLSKKSITLDKNENDKIIKVLIDGEVVWTLLYECKFLMHPAMATIYAPYIDAIVQWKGAKKAPPPPTMPAPPPYNRG